MKIDWLLNYKCRLDRPASWAAGARYGLFVSAFNDSDRVRDVFQTISADSRLWVFQSEYGYSKDDIASLGYGDVLSFDSHDESVVAEGIAAEIESRLAKGARLCIDITGFIRPHILALVSTLRDRGITSFDAVYSEPQRYKDKEETLFSKGDITEVRQVRGYEGDHISGRRELLIVGAGFDHELVAQVMSYKSSSYQVMLYGLPSLQPEMYQQSVLRLARVGDSTATRKFFCSASDPFMTAHVLTEVTDRCCGESEFENIYLSPLATKPQALGFALYYLQSVKSVPTSILFPFAEEYARDTGVGRARSWLYRIDLSSSA